MLSLALLVNIHVWKTGPRIVMSVQSRNTVLPMRVVLPLAILQPANSGCWERSCETCRKRTERHLIY